DRIERHLVLGESVTQAAQFVATGGAEAGLIALSVAPPLAARAKIRVLPETLHGPLIQRMAVVVGAGPTARAFYAFMQGPEAKTALRRAGFEIDS
ncbi:MAG: molybdate ABC transporter substrate-binding protein, partial [Alphaproteobacteria bacterium]|nr:molybdate ABC transporter substrate-binding protein [Alphaproteobacteria bacterium]